MTTSVECILGPGAGGNPPLHPGSLLRRCDEIQPADGRALRRAVASAHPGNRFGDFIRIELLGDGGMGEVWKAWDEKLRRWVALKFPKCETGSDLERLKEEAASAGVLAHPNVATVYGVGRANGHHFIAMQYIDGVTLARYPRHDRRKLIAFVRYAAMGVACAHSHGIIHRDLKPENIMVDREREQVYVTDFGIARQASATSAATGVIGTPPYMSPEQALGTPVDGRSDVYSLAATLYELLGDRPPFVGGSPADVLRKVLVEDPRPLRHLDADLNAILQKGLEKSRARRYQTVLEFADDLRRYLRDESVRARRSGLLTTVRRAARRHRTTGLAVAAGLAATLLVVLMSASDRRLERRLRESEEHRRDLAEAERRAQGQRLLEAETGKRNDLRELLVLWSRVGLAKQGWYQARSDPRATQKEIEEAVSALNGYVSRHPEQLQGYYVRARGRLYLDNLDGARSDLEKAIEIEPGFSPGWALLGRVKAERFFRGLIGDPRDYARRLNDSTPLLREANVAFERSRRPGTPDAAAAGWGLETMKDEHTAEVLARALAIAYVDRDLDGARTLLLDAHRRTPSEEYCNLLGVWAGDADRNIAWQSEALAIRPHFALAWFDRGAAKAAKGDPSGAMADYTKALEVDPRFLPARCNRAHLYLSVVGDPARALEDYDQMLKVDSRIASVYAGRARARVALGDLHGALRELRTAAELSPQDARLFVDLSDLKCRLKDPSGAAADAETALGLDPRNPDAHARRAAARAALGDAGGAREDSSNALLLDPKCVPALCTRAWARNRLLDPEGASRDATAALEIDPDLPAARVERSLARLRLNDPAGAREDATAALERDDRIGRARTLRSVARAQLGDLEGSLSDATQAIAGNPRDADAHVSRAAVRLRKGDPEGARADADHALALDRRHPDALQVRAAARIALGDIDGAIEDCGRILKEDPGRAAGYVIRGMAKERKGDLEGAIADATLALMLEERNAQAMSNRAAAKGLLENYEGAIDDATRALAVDPRYVPALLNRACARERKGDGGGAQEDYTRALEIDPADTGIRFKRGCVLMAMASRDDHPKIQLLLRAREDFARVAGSENPLKTKAEDRLLEIRAAIARMH